MVLPTSKDPMEGGRHPLWEEEEAALVAKGRVHGRLSETDSVAAAAGAAEDRRRPSETEGEITSKTTCKLVTIPYLNLERVRG